MIRKSIVLFFTLIFLSFNNAFSQYYKPADNTPKPSFKDKLYYGGNFSLSFGYTTFILINPLIGYRITDRLSTGLNLSYIYMRYRFNNAGQPYTYSSSIYGGGPFSRFFLTDWLFVHGEYNLYNGKTMYRMANAPNEIRTSREWVGIPLLGAGIFYRFSERGGFMLTALYNFNYKQDKIPLFGSPLIIRVGFTF